MFNAAQIAFPPLLQLKDVRKSYGGVNALKGVDFDVRPGEVHALVGENGAGKSTLIKIIAGAVASDDGEVTWESESVDIRNVTDSMGLGIRVIFQQLNVVPHMSVLDNLTLGREERTFGFLDRRANRQQASESLKRLNLNLELDRPASDLRVAEKQLVEIARALSSEAKLLIMDEPTASLGEHEVDELMNLIKGLRDKGIAVLYISHRLEEVLRIADRITVLRDGEWIATVDGGEATSADLVRMMVGRDLGQLSMKESHATETVVLDARSIATDSGLEDVTFQLRQGEVLGVYGLLGSGRTELARAIFGADPIVSGDLIFEGQRRKLRSPRDAMRLNIGLVAEDRETQGVFPQLSVKDNLMSASTDMTAKLGWIDTSTEHALASMMVDRLRIRVTGVDQVVSDLSGGNQQKVTVGRWLVRDSSILVLDDPTAGIDVGAKHDLYGLISGMTAAGVSIVLMSSDLPEILGLSDRIIVLREGRVVGTLSGKKMTQDEVGRLAIGG